MSIVSYFHGRRIYMLSQLKMYRHRICCWKRWVSGDATTFFFSHDYLVLVSFNIFENVNIFLVFIQLENILPYTNELRNSGVDETIGQLSVNVRCKVFRHLFIADVRYFWPFGAFSVLRSSSGICPYSNHQTKITATSSSFFSSL